MIFTVICFYWGFDNQTETVFVCNLWPSRYLSLESDIVRDEEIIHVIWIPWMASVNLMTHLKLSSLKMSTKNSRADALAWCLVVRPSQVPTSFVAHHSYLGERPRSNKVTMSGDTPPKSGHNSVHNASIMSSREKSQETGQYLALISPSTAIKEEERGKIWFIFTPLCTNTLEWLDPGRGRGCVN